MAKDSGKPANLQTPRAGSWNSVKAQLALKSLWGNKLRTILTLLGVVIGVASVITVVTLTNGAKEFVTTKINTLWRGCCDHQQDAANLHDD